MIPLHERRRLLIVLGMCFVFSVSDIRSAETELPNVFHIIKKMAQKHPNALKIAYNAYPDKTPTIKGSEFQDRVIQKLHSTNPRFGYVKNVDLRRIYPDLLCYSIKKGDPKGATSRSSELYAVDFIAGGHGSRFVWWNSPEGPVAGTRNYTCVYPRPGAPDYTSGGGSGEKMSAGGTDKGTPSGTVKGVCATYQSNSDTSCKTGKFHPHPPDTEKEYLWTCRNIPRSTGKTQCRQSKSETASTTPASTSSGDKVSPVDCRTLNTQMYVLRKQLDEHLKSYKGKRVKKWFGLKRDSCNNVKMKDREKFERCRGLASSIHNTREDLNANIREYNKRCRNR